MNKNSVNIITKREEESFQKNYEDLPWNNFKVGRKQKINIHTYLKKRIAFDQLARLKTQVPVNNIMIGPPPPRTGKIFNMRITNCDLGIPRKGDHHSSEYFEADDDKDIVKIERDDSEDDHVISSGKKQKRLKLRLHICKILLIIKHHKKILLQATDRAFIHRY